jgi:hypothetical protein
MSPGRFTIKTRKGDLKSPGFVFAAWFYEPSLESSSASLASAGQLVGELSLIQTTSLLFGFATDSQSGIVH